MTEPDNQAAKFCHSCTAPLNGAFKGAADVYCKYCSDESGALKSYDEAKAGVIHWLMSWQPGIDEATADQRAVHFMRAMPAWADRA